VGSRLLGTILLGSAAVTTEMWWMLKRSRQALLSEF
jgi:hypothetical protein